MVLKSKLSLRQGQNLVITPDLQQAIKLLQMSNVELQKFIEEEVAQNPLLELEEPRGVLERSSEDLRDRGPKLDQAVRASDLDSDNKVGSSYTDDPDNDDIEPLAWSVENTISGTMSQGSRSLDTDIENVYETVSASDWPSLDIAVDEIYRSSRDKGGAGEYDFDHRVYNLANTAAEKSTLRDYLIGQVNIDLDTPTEIMIARYLIDMLDDNGWFSGDLESVALALGCSIDLVEQTLEKCQQMDPPGVFGRTLAECLALQLHEKDRLDPAMQVLLDNLGLLGKRSFSQLRRLCEVDAEDLLQMVAEIK